MITASEVVKALEACDWSGVPIGNKAIIAQAIELLSAQQAELVACAVAAEREACAKIIDEMVDDAVRELAYSGYVDYYRAKAAEIRARAMPGMNTHLPEASPATKGRCNDERACEACYSGKGGCQQAAPVARDVLMVTEAFEAGRDYGYAVDASGDYESAAIGAEIIADIVGRHAAAQKGGAA